jgi:hypothetical protein
MRYAFVFTAALVLASLPAFAQKPATPSPAQQAQQERMTSCNADAGSRNFKGDARKDFMSACLSGNRTPQVMMKVCNAEATQEKMAADARKSYVSSCLKS